MVAVDNSPAVFRINALKPIIRTILKNPPLEGWTLQGFGMLRYYFAPELRLHIWDSHYKVEDVSELHDHPWHFHSCVIAGRVFNQRFLDEDPDKLDLKATHMKQTILCGEGGGVCGAPEKVHLMPNPVELYTEGQWYTQNASEVHISKPEPGSVTLCRRVMLDDADHAHVYWPLGKEWVTAEPRPATRDEVLSICAYALDTWF